MSDIALKRLIGTTCIAVLAAVCWYVVTTYQQSQSNDFEKNLAEHDRLIKEMQRRTR